MTRYYLNEPCRECPYLAKVPGWIGRYSDPEEFLNLIRAEQEMPCHSTVDYDDPDWQVKQWDSPRCIGQLMMANRMAKLFRDPEVAAEQAKCGRADLSPSEMVERHRKGMAR